MYGRYVDDIISSFNTESNTDKFYEILNKHHTNIKFTFVKQQNNQISFLDILIKKTMVKTFLLLFFIKQQLLAYLLII